MKMFWIYSQGDEINQNIFFWFEIRSQEKTNRIVAFHFRFQNLEESQSDHTEKMKIFQKYLKNCCSEASFKNEEHPQPQSYISFEEQEEEDDENPTPANMETLESFTTSISQPTLRSGIRKTMKRVIKRKKRKIVNNRWKYVKLLFESISTCLGLFGGVHTLYRMLMPEQLHVEVVREAGWMQSFGTLLNIWKFIEQNE